MMNSGLKMMDFVFKMMNSGVKTMNLEQGTVIKAAFGRKQSEK